MSHDKGETEISRRKDKWWAGDSKFTAVDGDDGQKRRGKEDWGLVFGGAGVDLEKRVGEQHYASGEGAWGGDGIDGDFT